MHHGIEFDLSGSSLATVLTYIYNQVVFRKKPSEEQPEAQLLLTRRGGGAYPRRPLRRYKFENLFHFKGNKTTAAVCISRRVPQGKKYYIEIFPLCIGHCCTILQVENSLETALSVMLFEILTLFHFQQKSRMAAESGEK